MSGVDVGNLVGGVELEDRVSSALDQMRSRLMLAGVDFDALSSKIVSSSNVLDQARNSQVAMQVELSKTQNEAKFLGAKMDELTNIIRNYGDKNGVLTKELQQTAKDLLIAKSGADALKGTMTDLDKSFQETTKSVAVTSQQIVAFGRGVQEAGIVLSTMVTAPLVAAGAAAIKFGSDFESASTKVITIGGATRKEMESLSSAVMQLAKDTGVFPAELEKGLVVVESAGFRGAKAMEVLATAAKMTAVGMGDIDMTTRAVNGAMIAYQKEGLSAAQVGDIFTKTVQLGNMKVDELVGALAKVAPVAAAMGVKFADVNAAVATFTHLGAPVQVAVTGIVAVLSTILRDGAKTEIGLKGLSMTMGDLRKEIEEKGLTAALIHLSETAKSIPGGMDQLAKVFPNIRALTLELATAGAQADRFKETADKLKDGSAALDAAFAETKTTWVQQFQEMEAAAAVLATKVGEDLLPILKDFASFMKGTLFPTVEYSVEVFTNLPTPIQEVGVALGGLAAIAGPSLIIVGEMIRSYGHISALFKDGLGIAEMLPTFSSLITKMLESKAASIAFGAGMALATAAVVAFAAKEVWDAGVIVFDLWKQHLDKVHDAQVQVTHDQQQLAIASTIAKRPITDLGEAFKIMSEESARLRAETQFVGPVMDEVQEKMYGATVQTRLLAAAAEISKNSIAALTPEVIKLTNEMFNAGMSSAEVVKSLTAHGLIVTEQKVAIENLHKAYVENENDLKKILAANEAAAMALVPLTAAQNIQAEQLLKLGLGHDTVARAVGVHVAQIQALVKADEASATAQKLQLKQMDDSAKRWEDYDAMLIAASGSTTAKMIADIEKWKAAQIKSHEDAKTDTADFWNWLALTETQMYADKQHKRLEDDANSKAHLTKEIADLTDYYNFILEHSSSYHRDFIESTKKRLDMLRLERDQWINLGSGIKSAATDIKLLSGEVVSLTEAMRRFNMGNTITYDLTTREGVENYRSANTGMNIGLSDEDIIAFIKAGGTLQQLLTSGKITPKPYGLPHLSEGGIGNFGSGTLAMLHGNEAIIPLDKGMGGGGIVFHTGAIQINWPILNDAKSRDEIGRVLGDIFVERAHQLIK